MAGSSSGLVTASRSSSVALAQVLGQRLEIAEEGVAVGVEGQAHRQLLDLLLVGGARQVARPLVEHGGEQAGGALLAHGLLRAAAVEGEADGDDGQALLLHQPGGNPAGAADLLDVGGARAALPRQQAQERNRERAGRGEEVAAEAGSRGVAAGVRRADHWRASAGFLSAVASSSGLAG